MRFLICVRILRVDSLILEINNLNTDMKEL